MADIKFCSPAGDRFVPVYGLVLDDNGKKVVDKIGERDIQSEIQASASPSLAEMIELYKKSGGDEKALSVAGDTAKSFFNEINNGVYVDVTGWKDISLDKLKGILDNASKALLSLSPDERAKIENGEDIETVILSRVSAAKADKESAGTEGVKNNE